jgi:DNA-3-methyladenine glycosylase
MILPRAFYERNALTVAKDLLGKVIVHGTPAGATSGRIVETEAYMGPEDKASHAYGGKRTRRTETQFGTKGHAYIYFIYGLYYCFNVTAGAVAGKPEAVLLRALEPVEGAELMQRRRPKARELENLANGPSKLCTAMDLTRTQNGHDVTTPPLYIENAPPVAPEEIVCAPRIGVDYADEWKQMPWRFYIKGNTFVSVKAKKEKVCR